MFKPNITVIKLYYIYYICLTSIITEVTDNCLTCISEEKCLRIYLMTNHLTEFYITPGRQQSKMLSTIKERGSKIDRNSVLDCYLSPVWRPMAIKNSVSNDF